MNIPYFIDDIKNNIDFFLRNKITFSRKNYTEQNENKNDIFESSEQLKHALYLNEKYNTNIITSGTVQNYLENLYCLDVLDKYISISHEDNITVLDIGAKNWNYAKGEYVFFTKNAKNISLNGIELDAFRMSVNLYTRYEIAKYHIKNLQNTKYIVGDFLKHKQKYDYIIWFLPFVTEYPLIRWGLPLKYFKPLLLLEHAYNSLNNGGELLIINQGKKEYNIQQKLNEQLKLNAKYYGKTDDFFEVYTQDKYACKIIKY